MAEGKPRVLPRYVLLSCVVPGLRIREWWNIMTQENPICYENTSGNERDYNKEDREGSINTLCKTTSAHDRVVHENGCALALMKCLIWTCFVSLIVIALWILMYWRQPPDVVDLSTNKGIYQPRLCLYDLINTL